MSKAINQIPIMLEAAPSQPIEWRRIGDIWSKPFANQSFALGTKLHNALNIMFKGKWVLFLLLLYTASAEADSTYLPDMAMRVCPSLASAQTQANESWALAKEPFNPDKFRSNSPNGCQLAYISIPSDYSNYPENSIQPFNAWSYTYDKSSAATLKVDYYGAKIALNFSFRLQQVRYYKVTFKANGRSYLGWVEVPRNPYLLAYLEDQKE